MKKILNALFVALLAVFTFSSCSDVPAPYEILEPGSGNQDGMQGGDAANPFGLDASNPVNDFSADFEEQPDFTPDGKFDSNLNYDYELVGWKNVAEVGDRKWTGVVFKSGEKYLRASSNKGKEASYTSWFISPAFNVEQIKDKTVSFDCAGAFFYQTTTLKVYFLELIDGVMKKTPLPVNGIPTSGENYKWVKGINVDLKDFAGKVGFIGFEYVGEGGEKKSTTYTLDNIKCGKSDSQPVDPQPEVPGEEVVVTKDAAYEESFASEFGKFTVEDKELGGLNFVWKIDTDRKYAKGRAYDGSTGVVAESWLVSPVLNLNALSKVSLNFSQCSFSAGQKEEFMLKVKNVTDNVDWSNVDFEMTTEKWKWIDNTVDLSAYAGKKIQIAFAYKNENSANANTWEVKNVKVSDGQGGGTVEPEPEPEPSEGYLIISEYVEGSANNKYIELYNPTSKAIDLSGYKLRLNANGKVSTDGELIWNTQNDHQLEGTLEAGKTIVYKHKEAALNLSEGVEAIESAAANFNGDDPIALFKGDVLIDLFGVPSDVHDGQTSAKNFAKDKTFRRKASVTKPSKVYNSEEWESAAKNDVSGLGKR